MIGFTSVLRDTMQIETDQDTITKLRAFLKKNKDLRIVKKTKNKFNGLYLITLENKGSLDNWIPFKHFKQENQLYIS